MVQEKGKSLNGDVKIETDDAKKTTLTIAQDFPKKAADHKDASPSIMSFIGTKLHNAELYFKSFFWMWMYQDYYLSLKF